jgi:hypothetical protein
MHPQIPLIEKHLRILFEPCADHYPDGLLEIRCIHPTQTATNGNKLVKAQLFNIASQINAAVKWAVAMNNEGFNAYVGVNPRKPGTPPFGAASAEDIDIAFFNFADIDRQESIDILERGAPIPYTFSVTTGTQPVQRPHIYWQLAHPVRNMKAWSDTQAGIADFFKSDRVIDPPRIMRLAGTVNWPDVKKTAKGYQVETVNIRTEYPEPREPVNSFELHKAFVTKPAPATEMPPTSPLEAHTEPRPVDRLGLYATGNVDVDRAIQSILAGNEWHNNMIRVVGHWMSMGRTDNEILLMCRNFTITGYTHEQTDREVMQAIEGGRRKGYDADVHQRPLQSAQSPEEPDFTLKPMSQRPPVAKLPMRRFLYGRHLIRGYVSATISPGGIGKTTLIMVEAIAMAANKEILGERIFENDLRVLHVNLEDPQDELDRRYYAIVKHFNLDHEAIGDRVFMHSGRDRKIILADKGAHGTVIQMPDADLLREQIIKHRIDVVSIDPIVKAHYLDENDNKQVDYLLTIMGQIAHDTNCAIDAASHTRKSPTGVLATAGDINQARGAGALAGAVRAARTLTIMSAKEAENFGITGDRAGWYVRVDDAKGNMTPPAEHANWYERHSVKLNNGGAFAEGDNVGVLQPWTPPDAFEGLTQAAIDRILNTIVVGVDDQGTKYSFRPQSNRWVGDAIKSNCLGKTDADAKQVIAAWRKSGLLFEDDWEDQRTRKTVKAVMVNAALWPGRVFE